MALKRLIYHSRPQLSHDNDVEAILASAQRRNVAASITGMLLHDPDYFVQVLEGGEREVTDCFVRIVNDARHRNVTLVLCEEIRVRQFGGWAMRQVNAGAVDRARLLAFSANATFEPAAMSPDGLRALCVCMAGQPIGFAN